jgi:hypothetical protein
VSRKGHSLGATAQRLFLHRFCWLLGFLVVGAAGCNETYRVGDFVLVMWNGEGPYPAYILEKKGSNRYRVHFDGYPERCDEDVIRDAISGRAKDSIVPANPPRGVFCVRPKPVASAGTAALYRASDPVRVTWRGSVYSAVILEVIARDRFLVHYEGYEDEWDEVVPLDRILGKR